MEAAFDMVKRQLFDQLHDVVRQRIFYVRPPGQRCVWPSSDALRAQTGAAGGFARRACERQRKRGRGCVGDRHRRCARAVKTGA